MVWANVFYKRGEGFFDPKIQNTRIKIVIDYSTSVESNCNQQDYMRETKVGQKKRTFS